MVAGGLIKKITLWLGMFSNVFDQKEIPHEKVVFALKWIIQYHNSFPLPSLNKRRVGTMVQYAEHIWKVFSHSEREKVHHHNPKWLNDILPKWIGEILTTQEVETLIPVKGKGSRVRRFMTVNSACVGNHSAFIARAESTLWSHLLLLNQCNLFMALSLSVCLWHLHSGYTPFSV